MPDTAATSPRFQHRFMVGPVRPGRDVADARRYWHEHHSKIVSGLPHLLGYVQNRALSAWRERIPLLACAETWYASYQDELDSYASDYYLETIVPDEERFIDRSISWTSPVASVEVIEGGPRAGLRVIAIGGEASAVPDAGDGVRVEVLHLRKAPSPAERSVVSVWSADRERADAIAARLAGVVFVCESVAVVPPPPTALG